MQYLPTVEFSRIFQTAEQSYQALNCRVYNQIDMQLYAWTAHWVLIVLVLSPLSSIFYVQIVTTTLLSKEVQLNLYCKQELSHRQMTEPYKVSGVSLEFCQVSWRLELKSFLSCLQLLVSPQNLHLVSHSPMQKQEDCRKGIFK